MESNMRMLRMSAVILWVSGVLFGHDGRRAAAAQGSGEGNRQPINSSSVSIAAVRPASVIAGNEILGAGYSGDGGPANKAQLRHPCAVAVDNSGNVLIADSLNGVIRKVDLTGAITTLARNHRDKPLPEGAVDYFLPFGIAVDDGGNVYVTDDSAVWKVNPLDGTATIFAGAWNKRGYSGDGGPATDALMGRPVGLAIDSRGNLFVVDSTNNTVRKVDSDGIITTVAGNQSLGFGYSGDGGPATSAQLRSPAGIAVDGAGNLFIADTYNSVIRKVNAKGIITTVAGLFVPGSAGYEGDGGPATKARLYAPEGVAVDRAGNLYIADTNNDVIRKVNAGGTISTLTGDHASIPPGVVVDSLSIGPDGVAVDKDGNLFVVYTRKNIVERVETNP